MKKCEEAATAAAPRLISCKLRLPQDAVDISHIHVCCPGHVSVGGYRIKTHVPTLEKDLIMSQLCNFKSIIYPLGEGENHNKRWLAFRR